VKGDRKALDDEAKISTVLGDKLEGAELQVKDLGPQISWRTVFLIEYVRTISLGPSI
jgi:very-long-chain enoyl-CoA reductase